MFPGAPDLPSYWNNLKEGVDAIEDVPPHRRDPVYYDPDSSAVDRFYCKRGGFIDAHASFRTLDFGVMPVAAQGAEPDQLLGLQVAHGALVDAGYAEGEFPREKTSVILGRGNYIGAGMNRLEQHVRTAEQVVTTLRDLMPDLPESELQRVKEGFREGFLWSGHSHWTGSQPVCLQNRQPSNLRGTPTPWTGHVPVHCWRWTTG